MNTAATNLTAAFQANPVLMEKLHLLEGLPPEEAADRLSAICAEAGTSISKEDLLPILKGLTPPAPGAELSTEHLEAVVGGTGLSDLWPFKQIGEALLPRKKIGWDTKIDDPYFT